MVRTICPSLEQGVPKDDFCVLFNLIVQWCHNAASETAPHQGWGFSPEISGRHSAAVCQGDFGAGAVSAVGRGTWSRRLGHTGTAETQELWVSSCDTISSSLQTDAHLLRASLLQPVLSYFKSDFTPSLLSVVPCAVVSVCCFPLCALMRTECPFELCEVHSVTGRVPELTSRASSSLFLIETYTTYGSRNKLHFPSEILM